MIAKSKSVLQIRRVQRDATISRDVCESDLETQIQPRQGVSLNTSRLTCAACRCGHLRIVSPRRKLWGDFQPRLDRNCVTRFGGSGQPDKPTTQIQHGRMIRNGRLKDESGSNFWLATYGRALPLRLPMFRCAKGTGKGEMIPEGSRSNRKADPQGLALAQLLRSGSHSESRT